MSVDFELSHRQPGELGQWSAGGRKAGGGVVSFEVGGFVSRGVFVVIIGAPLPVGADLHMNYR